MSKINIVVRLQHWMDSVPGQTFLNYAYSWGASIVILGALFKLTHLPGGNFMLFIGMGTETVVFFLSAFDRPFDKEEIGKELPADYETDDEIAARLGLDDDDEEEDTQNTQNAEATEQTQPAQQPTQSAPAAAIQPVYVAQPAAVPAANAAQPVQTAQPAAATSTSDAEESATSPIETAASAPANDTAAAAQAAIAANTPVGSVPFDAEAKRLAEIIRMANDELLHRAQAALSPKMEEATQEYIEKLRTLAETFEKVDEQSAKLTRDSEEMANLNRTLTAINKTYDLHFKSISQQVGTIDQINEQTRKLAHQIEELNGVYGRMIQALTVNMRMQDPAQQQAMQQPYAQQPMQQPYANPQQGSLNAQPGFSNPQPGFSNSQQGYNNPQQGFAPQQPQQ